MHASQGNIQGLADWGSMPHGVVFSVGGQRVSRRYVAGPSNFVNLNPPCGISCVGDSCGRGRGARLGTSPRTRGIRRGEKWPERACKPDSVPDLLSRYWSGLAGCKRIPDSYVTESQAPPTWPSVLLPV